MVKFMVKRASTQFADIIQERSISRIQYVEDGVQLATVNLPDALPSLWSSYGLPQPPDGSVIPRSMDTQSSGQEKASSSRKRRRRTSDSDATPNEAAARRSAVTHPERTTQMTTTIASTLHLNRSSPSQVAVPSPQAQLNAHFQPPIRLPDIHLTREGVLGGHGLPQRPHNGPVCSVRFRVTQDRRAGTSSIAH
ncbi:hypothetical protein K466DRAFT_581024 [Polyporus arcularius HHB13444]|uniref:Uncharacterized protein n=1 Tax=Polyporus arcularius HHB13444 TaxID=1314778 RepID=A0A5C3PZX3_9APHY|nr:hypothetical protein K466DRAFT_581024 [Polyporus arcularius HHB13444]